MDTAASDRLIVYAHTYCHHSRSLLRLLDENAVPYELRDVADGPAEYKDELKRLAKGNLSVPTVVFADGTVMVEPSPLVVLNRLKPKEGNPLTRLFKR